MRSIQSPAESALSQELILLVIAGLFVKAIAFTSGAVSIATAQRPLPVMASGVPLVAFGSPYYIQLLQEGYPPRSLDGSLPLAMNYFPLYPLISRVPALFLSPTTALLLVANIGSLGGIVFSWLWARDVTPKCAPWVPLLLMCFPTSMFLSAAYTEGLFLLFAAGALYFSGRNQFGIAALMCGAATATRPTGVAVVAVLFVLHLQTFIHKLTVATMIRHALIMLICVSGGLAFAGFISVRYGDLNSYLVAQRHAVWGEPGSVQPTESATSVPATAAPSAAVATSSYPRSFATLLAKVRSIGAWNKLIVWCFLAITVIGLAGRTTIPRPYFLLPLVIFIVAYVPQWGTRMTQIARFDTAAVPVFAVMAVWLTRHGGAWLPGAVCCIFLAAQAIYAWAFSRGIWCG